MDAADPHAQDEDAGSDASFEEAQSVDALLEEAELSTGLSGSRRGPAVGPWRDVTQFGYGDDLCRSSAEDVLF